MSYYFDRDGVPTDVGGFMAAFESNRRVGLTSITGGNPLQVLEVSTVFLGIDHSHGSGPPLLFETMVFGLPGGDEFCVRYSTEREAQEGHTAAVVEMAATMTRAVVLDLDPNEATTVGAPLTEIDTSE